MRTNVLKRFENQGPFIFYSHSLCVIDKSIDIIQFPNPQNFLTIDLPLLIQNAMARDLSDRCGSQKGHIETWYKFSQNGLFLLILSRIRRRTHMH